MSNQISTPAHFKRLIATLVASHGFAVIPVGYGECSVRGCCCRREEQPWTYTVGLVELGVPELVLLGLDSSSAHEGITWVVDRARMGFSVPVGTLDPLDDFGLKLVDVPFDWLATDPGRMAAWFNHYDSGPFSLHAPEVRQLLWADHGGKFPDDSTCDPRVVATQPILEVDPYTYPRPPQSDRNPVRHQKK